MLYGSNLARVSMPRTSATPSRWGIASTDDMKKSSAISTRRTHDSVAPLTMQTSQRQLMSARSRGDLSVANGVGREAADLSAPVASTERGSKQLVFAKT